LISMGELVHRVHLYVVPRYNGMPDDGFEVMRRMFEGEWSCSDAEAEPTQPVPRDKCWEDRATRPPAHHGA
jgi:hypothetical protein